MTNNRVNGTGLCVALCGAGFYALLITDALWGGGPRAFGGEYFDVFNQYYLAILEGKMDLPMRVLRIEGHFTPDGVGYIYHGVAPLLTRFVIGWALPLEGVFLIGPSIWFWAVIGTGLYHLVFHQLLISSAGDNKSQSVFLAIVVGFSVWCTAPGLILVSNHALTHETMVVSYALTAGFFFLIAQHMHSGRPLSRYIIGLAILAGLVVHARPNAAVGLYLGVLLICGLALIQDRTRAILPVMVALALLFVVGLAYLGINQLKFGDAKTAHGGFSPGALQYGSTFWGLEAVNSPRAAAFIEHGRFNLKRILPNLAMYTIDPPGTELQAKAHGLYAWVTRDLGNIRVEWAPGIVWLWMPWIVIGAIGLSAQRAIRPIGWILLITTCAIALLLLSYGTVTIRYRTELWPLVITVAMLGFEGFRAWLSKSSAPGKKNRFIFVTSLVIATALTLNTAHTYRNNYFKDKEWTYDECTRLVLDKGFSKSRVAPLCAV